MPPKAKGEATHDNYPVKPLAMAAPNFVVVQPQSASEGSREIRSLPGLRTRRAEEKFGHPATRPFVRISEGLPSDEVVCVGIGWMRTVDCRSQTGCNDPFDDVDHEHKQGHLCPSNDGVATLLIVRIPIYGGELLALRNLDSPDFANS
jgi:hypothetical protein